MTPFSRNLTIIRAATFRWSGEFSIGPKGGQTTPVDLTGCFAEMEIRNEQGDLLYAMPMANMTIPDPVNGRLNLYISDEDTEGFEWDAAVYDLFMNYANGDRDKFLRGSVKVQARVTRR